MDGAATHQLVGGKGAAPNQERPSVAAATVPQPGDPVSTRQASEHPAGRRGKGMETSDQRRDNQDHIGYQVFNVSLSGAEGAP